VWVNPLGQFGDPETRRRVRDETLVSRVESYSANIIIIITTCVCSS
jgi:hypothetical protein